MNCVFCLSPVTPEVNWTYLFSKEPIAYICQECKGKLAFIEGDTCEVCGRTLSISQNTICIDCRKWEKDVNWQGILSKNQSLFSYNEYMKELIGRFKYRGDYRIAAGFVLFLPKDFAKDKMVVPVPLSAERLYERGFNQVEAILDYANISFVRCLKRQHGEKQSKKTRQQRLEAENIFSLVEKDKISSQNILLVDDIYTTGATLRHAAKLLKEAGANSVTSLTIAR